MRTLRFEWDEAKNAENQRKHGVSFEEAESVFYDERALLIEDPDEALVRLMALPLRGLEEFVRRAGRPEAEIERAKEKSDYRLSERQGKAILEMRLARLTGLEQEKLAAEYGELCNEIARLESILANESVLMDLIVKELEEVKEKHAEERRTSIVENEAEIQLEDLIGKFLVSGGPSKPGNSEGGDAKPADGDAGATAPPAGPDTNTKH